MHKKTLLKYLKDHNYVGLSKGIYCSCSLREISTERKCSNFNALYCFPCKSMLSIEDNDKLREKWIDFINEKDKPCND